MRKLLIALLLLMTISVPAYAAEGKYKIGVFLEAPMTYASNEKVRTMVPEKIKTKLSPLIFDILPYDQTAMAAKTYREDNRLSSNQYSYQPLNRSDIQKIAKGLNCDYALFIIINNGPPRMGAGLFTISFKTTITCDVRLLDVETGNYLINKEIVKDGSSTSVLGVPSFNNAYNDALGKALDEFTIDPAVLIKPAV